MSVSRKSPRKQSDAVPQARPSHGTGDNLQPEASAPTPAPGGTTGSSRPVPIIINYLFSCALWPDNDPERPRCPACGGPPFDVRLSGLLDLATLAHEALSVLKHALEQEVRP